MFSISKIILFISFIVVLPQYLLSEESGSRVEVYTKSGNKIKGELVLVDSTKLQLEIRLPKTSGISKEYKIVNFHVNDLDSVNIPGSFEGTTPIILSTLLGGAATAVSISSSESNNFFVGSALGLLLGGFTYLFIDNTLTTESIVFTEIDKYPWKLKPFSRNYRSD